MDKYFNTLIVKFASPCNLNCTYCYEYNTGDDSWKKKPKFISLKGFPHNALKCEDATLIEWIEEHV